MNRLPRHLIVLGLLSCGAAGLAGQQAVSPEVQALYEHARSAQASNSLDQAVSDYRKILRLAPDLTPAYNNLGRLYYNLGRYPEALATLRKGLELAPEMHPAQVMLGATYFQLGRLAEAVAPLQAGVEAMPDDRFARLTLARTLIGLRRPEDAVVQLNALLKTDPKDQEAWYTLGKLHLRLSEQALAQVQAIDPNTPLAHELTGELMESMQNTPGAIAAYKQAVAAAPDDPQALEHLADAYWHTGDWAHARDAYRTLLAQQPGNCMAHWKLSSSLNDLSEAEAEAMKEINVALEQCPDLPQAHVERARLLLRAGKAAESFPDLRAAEKAAPDEPSVQRLLAQAYHATGDRARAAEANLRFQQLDKAEHDAKERHAASVVQANQ